MRARAAVAAAVFVLASCGGTSSAGPPDGCDGGDRVECAQRHVREVTTAHFRCVVYQAGGPNSARLWCDRGTAGAGEPGG